LKKRTKKLSSDCGVGAAPWMKVFLLLFLQKKKILASFPFPPRFRPDV